MPLLCCRFKVITTKQDPKVLKDNIRETTAVFLAKPNFKKDTFNQSLVPAHSV